MSISRLAKDGWFDEPKDLNILLTDKQLSELTNGLQIKARQQGELFTIEIRKGSNLKKLNKRDLLINYIPPSKETEEDLNVLDSPLSSPNKENRIKVISGFLGDCLLVVFSLVFFGYVITIPVIGLLVTLAIVEESFSERGWSVSQRILPELLIMGCQIAISLYLWGLLPNN